MAQTRRPLRVFYSYAHADEHLRDKLAKALALLHRQNYIVGWHDRCIMPGAVWAGAIDTRLAAADIVLLLISRDFMASDYCYETEMRTALQRHHEGVARVVPIVLRHTDWETSELARLQCLPVGAKPITAWDDEDAAFKNVAEGIRQIVEERQPTTPDETDASGTGTQRATVWRLGRQRWRRWSVVALMSLAGLGLVAYASSQSQTLSLAGAAWLDIGEDQRAALDFQSATRWNPFNRRARDGTRVAQVALARHAEVPFRNGLAALRASMPEHPHVQLLVGDLAYHEDRVGDALQAYQTAFDKRPSLAEASFRAGVVLRQRGDISAAATAFAQAMQANQAAPAVPRYRNNLAFCMAKLDRLKEALTLYGASQQYPLSALEASRLLLAHGEIPQAHDAVQRAVAWLQDRDIAVLPQNQGPSTTAP